MSDYVLDYVWAFALALIITFALTPLVKRFAVAVGAIDKPDARKVHHGAIPRLGGLAIFLGYVGSVLFNGQMCIRDRCISNPNETTYTENECEPRRCCHGEGFHKVLIHIIYQTVQDDQSRLRTHGATLE